MKGAQGSNYLFAVFKDNNFAPKKQSLVPADDTSFPQNILIYIENSLSKNPIKSKDSLNNEKVSRNNVIFSFTQQYAIENIDKIVPLVQFFIDEKLPYNAILLFSADDDNSVLNSSNKYHQGGTSIYTSSIDDSDLYSAIVFEKSIMHSHEIIPGGRGDTAPSWLVKTIYTSCTSLGEKAILSSSFTTLYRNGFLRENKRVSSFLKQEIPAASISIAAEDKDFEIIKKIATELSFSLSDSWDRHYAFLNIGKDGIWLSEYFYAFSYILFALVCLFIICFSPFTNKIKQTAKIKDTLRMWYFIPATILFTGLILFTTELCFFNSKSNAFLIIGIKILITFLFTSILFVIQLHFTYKISSSACGLLMLVISTANIFIFGIVDLSFIYLFFLEYLIVYFSTKFNHLIPLIFFMLLMIFPFIPYTIDLLKLSVPQNLDMLAKPGLLGNILCALIIFPFQMIFLRIIIQLNLFSKEKNDSTKTFILKAFLVSFSVISIFILFYLLFTETIVRNNLPKPKKNDVEIIEDAKEPQFTVSLENTTFLDLTARHVILKCNENVVQYIVSVTSNGTIPLYDCNYDYTFEGSNTVYFNLPDYPSGTIEIIYSSDPLYDSVINIEAYIVDSNDSNKIHHEYFTKELKADNLYNEETVE
ncbi:MAG: hypothetical protein WCQ67_04315 [Treponema sp.]